MEFTTSVINGTNYLKASEKFKKIRSSCLPTFQFPAQLLIDHLEPFNFLLCILQTEGQAFSRTLHRLGGGGGGSRRLHGVGFAQLGSQLRHHGHLGGLDDP